MLISCKCLNFIATVSNNEKNEKNDANDLMQTLLQAFLQKYPRNFVFYSACMEFFKQSLGPLTDFTINVLSQRDLIYSLTLDVSIETAQKQSWQFNLCVNCNTLLCAKRLFNTSNHTAEPQQQYLINSSLIITNDELTHRRADRSFSEAFGLLIMDHPTLTKAPTTPPTPPTGAINNFTVGSVGMSANSFAVGAATDSKQQRLRQLQQNLQQRLKREIAETNERIQRYTEQQFALLKSFREKSEQEYELLVRLIQQVPEQNAGNGESWLDRLPPALEVNSEAAELNYASARRRNTISSRRELTTTANASSVVNAPLAGFPATFTEATTRANTTTSAIDGSTQTKNNRVTATSTNITTANSSSSVVAAAAVAARKMSNFDTPPATPEATPMSVGNSPTFRPQEQQTQPQQQQQPPQSFGSSANVRLLTSQMSFQQQFPTPTAEPSDDCIFELEGVESSTNEVAPQANALHSAAAIISLHQQQQQFQRSLSLQQQPQSRLSNHHYMSDVDESDGDAEEATDALDMDSSHPMGLPIASRYRNNNNNMTTAQMLNFAKSLPIEIANSPMAERATTAAYHVNLDDDELDNTVDIAASIKALAKSVHGEAVFGDLPRPRLRSQI